MQGMARCGGPECFNDALDEAVELLRPSLCDGDGNWTADYVRIRVEAVKP